MQYLSFRLPHLVESFQQRARPKIDLSLAFVGKNRAIEIKQGWYSFLNGYHEADIQTIDPKIPKVVFTFKGSFDFSDFMNSQNEQTLEIDRTNEFMRFVPPYFNGNELCIKNDNNICIAYIDAWKSFCVQGSSMIVTLCDQNGIIEFVCDSVETAKALEQNSNRMIL
jgi:hypothetical protein